MRPKPQERGQALVIIALAVVGLFGFSALAIDGSRVFSDRRNAQNAADTAALSAALAKIRQENFAQAATERAFDNGYNNNRTTNFVDVAMCNTLSGVNACQGIPAPPAPGTVPPPTTEQLERSNPANYVQVQITSLLPATFARIVGRQQFKNIVSAIAYAGPVEPKPLADGYAIAAMDPDDWDAVFSSGNIRLDVNNSGIFSNSNYQDPTGNCSRGSMRTGGNGTVSVDTGILTVGEFCDGGNATIQPSNAVVEGVGPIDYPPTVSIPGMSCPSPAGPDSTDSAGRKIIAAGTHNARVNLVGFGEVIFSPGVHCFQNGLSILGPKVIADNVRFLFTGGDFGLNGGSLTCNDMLVHVNGGSGVHFGGNGHVYCNSVTFFLSTGDISWNGNPDFRIYAPTGGDYEGLLIYLPPSNTNSIFINGNATSEMTGTILAVKSPVTINGNNWTTGLNSQIVGGTVSLEGNGDVVINYNPDDQYQPIDPSAITLTK